MKQRVLVAFGGVSVEHEISILSAMQVMAAMDEERYSIIPFYIAKDGRFYSDEILRDLHEYQDLAALGKKMREVTLMQFDDHFYVAGIKKVWHRKKQEFDIAMPILHGTNGEDGCFQGYLETLQIPYTGSHVTACAIAQNKVVMKMLLQDRGLPIVPWFYWQWKQKLSPAFFEKAMRLGYPMVVKPASLGSSIGVKKVENEQELFTAMVEAFQYDDTVVIEKAVEHLREINAALLQDKDQLRVSVLEEVIKHDSILSYQDKYLGSDHAKGMAATKRIIPAELDEMEMQIRQYAMDVFETMQAEGVVRIDFLINDETKDIYVNEINTIPGSLSFYLWEKSGISFSSLIDTLILQGWKHEQRKRRILFTHENNVLKQHHGSGKIK